MFYSTVPHLGCSLPYTRRDDDSGAAAAAAAAAETTETLIDADLTPTNEHAAGLEETQISNIECMPDYRNRINEIIEFIKSDHVQYTPGLIVDLTPAQKENKRLFRSSAHALRYNRLHPNIVKVFMSGFKKIRPDGKH